MQPNTIRIATRKSALAMWQAEFVRDQLKEKFPHLSIELVPMVTKGDKILDAPLAKVGGKGLFIKELEIAMQEGRADIAVHSMKDVPVEFPDGFSIHAICKRENPLDAFVSNDYKTIDDLPAGARVGTSSLRRQCQIKRLRPDLEILDLRGNVNTRLAKLDDGQYDAIILAAAGLIRLKMEHRINTTIPSEVILPAVGQGAVGIECRDDDAELIEFVSALNHGPTAARVKAERTLNKKLNGGCQVPIGSFAELIDEHITLRGLVGATDGSKIITAQASSHISEAEEIGKAVAEKLIAQGAEPLLEMTL